MTPTDNQSNAGGTRTAADAGSDVDKILDHNRLQLSALLDGELPLEEARFLLRRLQHDDELGGCWERWQLCGDVLRGQSGALLPSGFAQRVSAAVAGDRGAATTTATSSHRWLRWSGSAALAASVAVIALLLVRQSPDAQVPAVPASQVATATPAPAVERPVATVPPPVVPDLPEKSPDQSTQLVSALAVADVPRRMTNRRSRGQSQRAARRSATRAPVEMPVAIAASGAAPAPVDPFSNVTMPDSTLPNRPWPRALLPGTHASGAFTVDYGNPGTRSSFYPFVPRTMPVTPAEGDGGREELRNEQ
jgi:negative regulator of sigma E activity